MKTITIEGKKWKILRNFQNKQILATDGKGMFAIAECEKNEGTLAVRVGEFTCPIVTADEKDAIKLFALACDTYSPKYGYMLRGNAKLQVLLREKPQNRGNV